MPACILGPVELYCADLVVVVLIAAFLESNSRVTVFQIDRATGEETVFAKGILHGVVIGMGIDFKIVALGKGVFQTEGGNPFLMREYGNSMDDTVGKVVKPLSVIDPDIGWVRALEIA